MSEEPSTSSSSAIDEQPDEDEDLLLKDDAAEIERLQLPIQSQEPQQQEEDDERIARIEFRCSCCDMHELVHYYGREPPFALGILFREDTYVMRDPFQAPPPRWQTKAEYYIAMGVNCANCSIVVCKDSSCSFYYTKTLCLPCGAEELKSWPVEAQTRLRKQLAAAKESGLLK
ncbi:cysteine-rich DPF motif domain-containing protein 1 [Drosophila nasuta]|uniref:cysteine-rich DPF motif domain-containing protein 1 n=1 Tax=Drosophila nasuta TaxID=42062 RepID=UPI00295EF84C|nr:cysteine-rich DPF motif domain-containing protein 1 [Drosophila nasuta]